MLMSTANADRGSELRFCLPVPVHRSRHKRPNNTQQLTNDSLVNPYTRTEPKLRYKYKLYSKSNTKEFSSLIVIDLSSFKIDVTTCPNTRRITSRFRTKTVTVNFHGANHKLSSDVVGMSRQSSYATLLSVVCQRLSDWTVYVILTTSVSNFLKSLISTLGVKLARRFKVKTTNSPRISLLPTNKCMKVWVQCVAYPKRLFIDTIFAV